MHASPHGISWNSGSAMWSKIRSSEFLYDKKSYVLAPSCMQNRQKVNFSTVNQQVPSIDKVNFLFLLFYSSHWFNVSHDIAIVKLSS